MPQGPTNPEPTADQFIGDLWHNLTASYPRWLKGCHFSPTALRALVEVAGKLGFMAGVRRGRADVRMQDRVRRLKRANYEEFLLNHLGKDIDGQEETAGPDAVARPA